MDQPRDTAAAGTRPRPGSAAAGRASRMVGLVDQVAERAVPAGAEGGDVQQPTHGVDVAVGQVQQGVCGRDT